MGRSPHPQKSTHQRERAAVPRPPAPKPPESDRGRKLSHVNRGRPGLGFPALAGGLGTARPAPRPGVCGAPAGGAMVSCAPLDPQRAGRDAKPSHPCACYGSEVTVRTGGRAPALEGCPSGAPWSPRGSSGGLASLPPHSHTYTGSQGLGHPHPPTLAAGKGQAEHPGPGLSGRDGNQGGFPGQWGTAERAACPGPKRSPSPVAELLTMSLSSQALPYSCQCDWNMILRSRGAVQRPLQVPLRALDGQQQGGWRQADTAFEVGSSEQRREGAGGRPRSQPCPLPSPPLSNRFFN